MTYSRRQLITGVLGTALLPEIAWSRESAPGTRIIPSTGEAIPAIGLGTWITFNVGQDPVLLNRSADVMAAFLSAGGGMIDSSPMYGSSQKTIGYGLNRLGRRDAVFAADKVWTGSVGDGPGQIATSGRNWGISRFDLLQVHNLVSWEGHLDMLFAMKAAGRLRYAGITTSHGRRHGEMEAIMRRHPLDFVQLTYNTADREAEDRLLPLAWEKGIAVIVNRPFRRGALLRRLAGQPLPGVAHDLGVADWSGLILKFILSHPAVTVAIPATTSVAHVRRNKNAARGAMPDLRQRQAIIDHLRTL